MMNPTERLAEDRARMSEGPEVIPGLGGLSGVQLLQAIPAPLLVAEAASGRIVFANAAAEALLRTSAVSATGKGLAVLPPSLGAADGGGAVGRWRLELPGPSYVLMQLREKSAPAPLPVSAGEVYQAQKLEVIGSLAGGIAHDFNNLLTVILGFSELLQSQLDPMDPRRALVDEIARAGDRAAGLTRQLLAFSRRQRLEPVELDLNTVVREMATLARPLIGVNIELVTRLAPALGHIYADAGQLHQVLLNLVVNARDAMPAGGTLAIETANVVLDAAAAASRYPMEPGPYIQLTVRDTGQGMDAETQAHLFEPFFTTKGPGQGTGLGLATVYGIVKQSEGYIWVHSAPGKGTTFSLYFPPREVSLVPTARRTPLPAQRPGVVSHTLLLVEDGDAVRQLARAILHHQGFTLFEARDGEAALELFREAPRPIDLLITDVVLPGINEHELATQVRALQPRVKILYMSGFSGGRLPEVARGPGVGFLQKPFTPAALSEQVALLLRDV